MTKLHFLAIVFGVSAAINLVNLGFDIRNDAYHKMVGHVTSAMIALAIVGYILY